MTAIAVPGIAIPLRAAELFSVPSDSLMGAAHVFALPKPLKRSEAQEHYRLGVEIAHQEYPDFAAARDHLLEALRYEPDFVAALVALGDVERNPFNPARDVAAASRAYDRALSLDSDSATARLGRVNVLIDLGDLEAAEGAYADLLRRHARFAKYAVAERYEAEARPPFGWFYPRKRHIQLLKRLGDAYYAAGRYEDAAARFERILGDDSRDVEVRLALGFARQRAGDLDRAETVFGELLANPMFVLPALLQYRVWFVHEIVVPAVQTGHVNEQSGAGIVASARNQLGLIHLARGHVDDAHAVFGNGEAHGETVNNLGITLLMRGKREDAAEMFAMAAAADVPEGEFNRAVLLQSLGRWGEAGEAWEALLAAAAKRRSDPPAAEARYLGAPRRDRNGIAAEQLELCRSRSTP